MAPHWEVPGPTGQFLSKDFESNRSPGDTHSPNNLPIHHSLIPPILAEIFGFSLGQISGLLIPIAGIILAGVITVSGMYFHSRKSLSGAREYFARGSHFPDPAGRITLVIAAASVAYALVPSLGRRMT